MFNVGRAVAYLDLDISKFKAGMTSAMAELSTFKNQSAISMTSAMDSIGKSMATAGSTLTKTVTLPLVGIGTTAVATAATFDSSMSKVKAISGATSEQMSDLRDKAIEMGAKTKFSAKESADAFTYMAMAGWDAGQMIDGISGIMSLAAADGLDLATTSDIVTDALTAFGLKASDAGHFADVLAQASSSANTNVSMLGESFKYVAPVAGSLGMSVEDTSLALGLMANAGIKSSQAGTALRTSLTNLVKPTDNMAAKMEELGIEVVNSDGSMKSLRDIMTILRDKFSVLSEAEQANAAATIFGKEAMSGMLAIINASENDFNSLANAIDNSTGRADDMADTMMNNLNGAITLLKSALESLAIKIGSAMTPVIRQWAESITKLVEWLNTLSDEQIQMIIKIAAIVAAIGPVLLIVGKLITAISTIIKAVSSIGTAIKAIGPIITGVISIGSKLFAGIGAIASFISGTLIPAIAAIAPAIAPIVAEVAVVIAIIGALVAAGIALYKNWDEIISGISNLFKNLSKSFTSTMKNISDTLSNAVSNILKSVGSMFDSIISSAKTFFSNLGKNISNAFNSIIDSAKKLFNTITTFAGNFFNNMKDNLQAFAKNITTALSNLATSVSTMFSNLITDVTNLINNLISNVAGLFENIKNLVKDFVSSTINNISNWAKGMVNNAKNMASNFSSAITNGLSNLSSSMLKMLNACLIFPHLCGRRQRLL